MATDLLYPDDIDARLNWPPGRAARLARRRRLPHYVLPDGAVRLRWDEVVPLVRRVAAGDPLTPPDDTSTSDPTVPVRA